MRFFEPFEGIVKRLRNLIVKVTGKPGMLESFLCCISFIGVDLGNPFKEILSHRVGQRRKYHIFNLLLIRLSCHFRFIKRVFPLGEGEKDDRARPDIN